MKFYLIFYSFYEWIFIVLNKNYIAGSMLSTFNGIIFFSVPE